MSTTALQIRALIAEANAQAHSEAMGFIDSLRRLSTTAKDLQTMPLPVGVIETARVFALQAEAAALRIEKVMNR